MDISISNVPPKASSGNLYSGDTTIDGVLTATRKSFLIPHPTKEDKQLQYASLEGPENGVYIRGKLKGDNIIELPHYWSELIDESTNLDPQNPYAESKIETEKFLFENKNNFKFIILRYFNVAGADEKMRSGLISNSSTNLIKAICETATKKRKKIIINGDDYKTKDGTAIRDFIHVSDIADIHGIACEAIFKNKSSGIFNCGYGRGYSVKEVISEMENIISEKLKVEIGPRRNKDISISIANSEKFKKTFNWKPKFNNLNYILKTALEWEKIN